MCNYTGREEGMGRRRRERYQGFTNRARDWTDGEREDTMTEGPKEKGRNGRKD